MIRRTTLALAILFAVFPIGGSARGDLCLEIGPRAALDDADAAFIGRLISRDEPKGNHVVYRGRDLDLVFAVEEAVKGHLGRQVRVRSDELFVPRGKQVGLFLERSGDIWLSGSCSKIDPDALRRAAAPLPAPDSIGPVSFLVGGRFGDVRTIALDREARVVAYGNGQGYTAGLAVCEGSRRVVEVFREVVDGRLGSGGMAVREIATLALVRESRIEELEGGGWWPVAASCRDGTGDDVFIAVRDDDRLKVIRVRGGKRSVVFEGRGRVLTFSATSDVAYLTAKKSIVELDLRTSRTRTLVTLPLTPRSLVPNLGESVLAGTNGSHPPQGRVFTFDLRTREVSIVQGLEGEPVWLDRSRFVVLGDVHVYDTSLDAISSWRQTVGSPAVAVNGRLYGAAGGEVVTASGESGVRVLRKLEYREVVALVYVQNGPTRPPAGVRLGLLAIVLS